MKILLLITFACTALMAKDRLLGFRHLHNGAAHKAESYIEKKAVKIISNGRVNVYKVKDKNFDLKKMPQFVQDQFFYLDHGDLSISAQTQKSSPNKVVSTKLQNVRLETYKNYVESLVAVGNRSKGAEAKSFIVSELQKINLNPIRTDYNIVSFIQGLSDRAIVVIGHMDTVSRTVGADDNASGAGGVLELARATIASLQGETPKKSIYFVLSEDEEDGLLGAKRFVKKIKSDGKLKNIDLAINMDMIAYNSNGVVDIETNRLNKDLANYFAQKFVDYTDLKPNLVLSPWGSDHIPFLNNSVPAVLTIENWKNHTPCWHKSCDTLDTLNFDYALKILKVNLAVILDKVL